MDMCAFCFPHALLVFVSDKFLGELAAIIEDGRVARDFDAQVARLIAQLVAQGAFLFPDIHGGLERAAQLIEPVHRTGRYAAVVRQCGQLFLCGGNLIVKRRYLCLDFVYASVQFGNAAQSGAYVPLPLLRQFSS